jgi:hypothetical protein
MELTDDMPYAPEDPEADEETTAVNASELAIHCADAGLTPSDIDAIASDPDGVKEKLKKLSGLRSVSTSPQVKKGIGMLIGIKR